MPLPRRVAAVLLWGPPCVAFGGACAISPSLARAVLEFIACSSSSEPLGLLSATTAVALSRFVDVAMLSVEVLVAKTYFFFYFVM